MTDTIAGNDEGQVHRRQSPRRLGPLAPGLLVITLGVVFLLDNLGFVRPWQVLRFWPVLLIAAGVKYLWEARDRGAAVSGTLLASAGGLAHGQETETSPVTDAIPPGSSASRSSEPGSLSLLTSKGLMALMPFGMKVLSPQFSTCLPSRTSMAVSS